MSDIISLQQSEIPVCGLQYERLWQSWLLALWR